MNSDSNDETNFANKLLLNDRQVSKLCKAFTNNSSVNIDYQKLICLKLYIQEDFLVDFFNHW